ncbi:MAG: hypothetical protein KGR26_08815, partial [Cyanobacteria bacterium REEB65]|nr:hypothetical protein [Cyanobacteria bacterium REEB65]
LALVLWHAARCLLTQALPGLLLPLPFLQGLGYGYGPHIPVNAPGAIVGLALAIVMLVAAVQAARRFPSKLPAVYVLLTLAMVVGWAGAFQKLGWDLQVRLLLPVAPLVSAMALECLVRTASSQSLWRRRILSGVFVAILAWIGSADRRVDRSMVSQVPRMDRAEVGLLGAAAYIEHLPAKVDVAVTYPFQAYFYAPRPYWAPAISAAGLVKAHAEGVRVFLEQPWLVGGHDIAWEAVHALLAAKPPRARILYVGGPHVAVVHLL